MKQSKEIAKFTALRRSLLAAIGLVALLGLAEASAAPGDQDNGVSMPGLADPEQINGAVLQYQRIAGSAFIPFATSAAFAYPGNGCINKTGGTETRFAHKVMLPAGSIVKYVRLYYFDNSASSVTAFFTTYDAAGNFNEIASVGSTDTGGYGSSLTPEMTYEVDPFVGAVNIVANLGAQDDSTLRFCGVRIAYIPAITDRIFADGFD